MNLLSDLHFKNNAVMGIYNHQRVPSSYHDIFEEYKAVRENALLVDYSHMSITSVMGDDAWALVNYMVSADVSIIRDEQGIYSLLLNADGGSVVMHMFCAPLMVIIFYPRTLLLKKL